MAGAISNDRVCAELSDAHHQHHQSQCAGRNRGHHRSRHDRVAAPRAQAAGDPDQSSGCGRRSRRRVRRTGAGRRLHRAPEHRDARADSDHRQYVRPFFGLHGRRFSAARAHHRRPVAARGASEHSSEKRERARRAREGEAGRADLFVDGRLWQRAHRDDHAGARGGCESHPFPVQRRGTGDDRGAGKPRECFLRAGRCRKPARAGGSRALPRAERRPTLSAIPRITDGEGDRLRRRAHAVGRLLRAR